MADLEDGLERPPEGQLRRSIRLSPAVNNEAPVTLQASPLSPIPEKEAPKKKASKPTTLRERQQQDLQNPLNESDATG